MARPESPFQLIFPAAVSFRISSFRRGYGAIPQPVSAAAPESLDQ